ncbi:hypothetical protein ES703_108736 [subsurface metagenome]
MATKFFNEIIPSLSINAAYLHTPRDVRCAFKRTLGLSQGYRKISSHLSLPSSNTKYPAEGGKKTFIVSSAKQYPFLDLGCLLLE